MYDPIWSIKDFIWSTNKKIKKQLKIIVLSPRRFSEDGGDKSPPEFRPRLGPMCLNC